VIVAFRSSDESYEAFFRAHVEEFSRFLAGVLGSSADTRGGRAGVADTLQEAMLRILGEWGELETVGEDERARRLYRCLRDAAGEALRREHGRRGARHGRPRVVAYDFGALEADGEELEPRERELTVAVLGAIVRDLADGTDGAERRALLDRGVLLAGLRALSEREAVVMIAVDRLGWDQRELADRLGVDFGRLRETLFVARKLFYGVVRHAVGVEIDDSERAHLHAYLAGELVGRERRLTRRHVQHCRACQALVREQRVFTNGAQQLLAPLPFVTAAHVLSRPATIKSATASGATVGVGLLGQPGAAKALAATLAMLGTGVGVNAWLSIGAEQRPHAAAALTREPTPLAAPMALSKLLANDRRATAAAVSSRDLGPRATPSRRHDATRAQRSTHPTRPGNRSSRKPRSSATTRAGAAPMSAGSAATSTGRAAGTPAGGSAGSAASEFSFESH
jgi:DNA-directed RNA polymerase specialized sigma24 family protein